MKPSPLPSIGEVVSGKYRIDSVIGEGGMGIVLGAVDTSLNRPVAIKFLTPARALNEAAAQRFGREARAAASIQSEHVVRVYEVGSLPNGAPYIVMEHLRGSDLAHVVDTRGGLPIDEAADMLLQTCEALGEAHARGIVHRDLKPQNLFLTQRNDGSPCVKVLDFGISKSADTDESSPKLTSTDMVMGTPLYMSPEQVRSLKSVDARADVWALGAILQELITASPPFDGPSASALHAAIAMDPPVPLRSRRPDAPAELEAVIARCLEKKPADRFQDVGALADALAPFATERGRTSASRIGKVVRTTSGNSGPPPAASSKPSGDQPTVPIGMASTMDVRSGTDGAWEQKPSDAVSPPPVTAAPPRSKIRAGMIAAGVLFVGGGALAGFALRSSPPATTTTVAPPPVVPQVDTAPPVVVASSVAPIACVAAPVSVAAPSLAAPSVAAASKPPRRSPSPMASASAVVPPPPLSAMIAREKETFKSGEEADLRALHEKAERDCALYRNDLKMATIGPMTAQTKDIAARTARFVCHEGASSTCQRQVCIQACGILGDSDCVSKYSNMMPPAKF